MTDHRTPPDNRTSGNVCSCGGPLGGGRGGNSGGNGFRPTYSLRSERFLWSGWPLLPHYFLYLADGSYVIADWLRCPLMHKITTVGGQICDPLQRPRWVNQTNLFDIGKNAGNDAETRDFLLFVARNNGLVAEILYRHHLSGELPRHHNEWGPNWRPL